MKDNYILSKQENKKMLNIIKLKKIKDNNEKLFFEEKEKEKENNKKHNKKNISKITYNIENKKKIKLFGNEFINENKKNVK